MFELIMTMMMTIDDGDEILTKHDGVKQ